MNQHEYLAEFKQLTEQMYEITKKKNADYTGDSSQPFKNFTMVEMIGGATTEQGFFTRMTDKLMRFAGFIKNGTLQVQDEKIEDTLLDLANYCLLCICYLRSKKKTTMKSKFDEGIEKYLKTPDWPLIIGLGFMLGFGLAMLLATYG